MTEVVVVMVIEIRGKLKLQSDHHQQSILSPSLYIGRMPFLSPSQQCQSTQMAKIAYLDQRLAYSNPQCGNPVIPDYNLNTISGIDANLYRI